MAPSVSVVICTYTPARWNELRAAVDSVRAQTLAPAELIVVVDHNDALRQRVAAELDADRVIENTQRRGLSGARNSGVGAARGDIVAFLDDDAAAEPEWLAHLTAPYTHERVVGVGRLVVPRWAAKPPAWFPGEFGWVVGCSYRGLPEGLVQVRNPIGANMSFRRRGWARGAMFDADLAVGLQQASRVRIGPTGRRLARLAARRTLRRPTGASDAYLVRAADRVRRTCARYGATYSVYVFGHSHVARDVTLGDGRSRYLNCGTWSSHLHAGDPALAEPDLFPYVEIERSGDGVTAAVRWWRRPSLSLPLPIDSVPDRRFSCALD
jgi:glycosyltransferase involved in cell wall biosynthesis